MKINWPIVALAIAAFGIGTTEFAPMGLLPVIAADLKITIPRAGMLVTGYALGVMAGAPLLTLTTGRVGRKTLLIALMGLFTLGNALSAWAPAYGLLLTARVLTSLAHGTMFGVGSVVAGSLVPKDRQAQAVASMFMGLTIANIGGVPAATAIGQAVGWRVAFWGIAGLGVIAMVALALALPAGMKATQVDARRELGVLRQPAVLLALATTVLGSGAMFAVFTYIAPILQNASHVKPATVTIALIVYGVGLTVGNWLGGRFADRALRPTLIVVLSALVALLLLFALTMRFPVAAIATVFAWGVATFALVPSLQVQIMRVAAAAPNLASAINIGAFNLGNALGAALGGVVLAAGFGYPMLALTGAALAGAGLACVLFGDLNPAAPSNAPPRAARSR